MPGARLSPLSAAAPSTAARLTVIIVATLVAYAPAYSAGFIWDDDDHVTNNVALRSLQGLRDLWFVPTKLPQYYPLTHTTFWVEYQLWGLNPAGYHVDNVLLHAANAALLWLLLRRLAVPSAFWAALAFALHPIHVESVAWVTERKNLLSGLFYLLSASAYLRSCDEPARRARHYALSLLFFTAAMLSKTVACSLPAALLLAYWWKKKPVRRSTAWSLAPFFVIGLAMARVTDRLEVTHVLARGPAWELTLVQRCLIACRAIWFYAGKIFWPAGFSFSYRRWDVDPRRVLQWLPVLGAAGVVAALWAARRHIGRGPLVGVLFFVGTLTPALGFFNIYPMRYSFVADHFAYLASVGLLTLAAETARIAAAQLERRGLPRGYPRAAGALVVVVLSIATFRRAEVFHDPDALWSDALSNDPASGLAHQAMAKLLLKRGDRAGAHEHFLAAARYGTVLYEPRVALGTECTAAGRFVEADRWLAEAARLQPDSILAHQLLAFARADLRDYGGALAEYLASYRLHLEKTGADPASAASGARALFPDLPTPDAYADYAEKSAAGGHTAESVAGEMKALALDPGLIRARDALERLRRPAGAGGAPGNEGGADPE